MAIIPCRECAHQISDQATSCPGCGAPVREAVKTRPRGTRVIFRTLLTLMALWTLGTLVWLFAPSGASDQLIARAKSSLQHLDRGIIYFRTADRTRAAHGTEGLARRAAADQPAASVPVSNRPRPAPALRSVYHTTAEQLYRDYAANAVATQTKIGSSRVRVSGSVAEIDQDTTGRPLVKLWTGKDSSAATMALGADQRSAAAQLTKGEAAEIECDQVGGSGASLQGSDCILAAVDFAPREVNLTLRVAGENGTSRVYVVGPMSEADCVSHSTEISSKLREDRRGEHVVAKNCVEAAHERISLEGCRLNTLPVNIEDLPTARLRRYDCSSPAAVERTSHHRRKQTTPPVNATMLVSMAEPATIEQNAESAAAHPIAAAAVDAVAVSAPTTAALTPTAVPMAAEMASPAQQSAERTTTNNIRLASAGNSDTGAVAAGASSEEATVVHAMQGQAKGPVIPQGESHGTTSQAMADDLAHVRAVDPQAADHIASYCAQTAASGNGDMFVADCRRSEAAAWTRLVLQNEFPTLDDATRKRCKEPPFPDTYVAKETCARYVLRVQ